MPNNTTAAALVWLLLIATLTPAAADPAPGPAGMDDARRQVEELERDVEGARAGVSVADEALSAVEEQLRRAGDALVGADAVARATEREAELARSEAAQALGRYERSRAALDTNRERLDDFARRAYKYGPAAGSPALASFGQLVRADGLGGFADTLHIVEMLLGDRADLVVEAGQLVDRTARLAEAAAAARRYADGRLAAAAAARDDAAARHAEVTALVDEAAATLEARQATLSVTKQELTDGRTRIRQLEERQAAERRAAEADARRRAAPPAPQQRSGSGAPVAAPVPVGPGLVTVGGITVAASLGDQLRALLEHAASDGIVLGGSGYRSPETTARLRIVNGCPDVYDSPASACRIPTAPPGTSMHERGLAVDFTWRGRTICYPLRASSCRGNAAFDWLAANAASHGLYVLPSEAWHWSTNGN